MTPDPKKMEREVHDAFYRLTVAQRDAAWRECEQLRAELAALRTPHLPVQEQDEGERGRVKPRVEITGPICIDTRCRDTSHPHPFRDSDAGRADRNEIIAKSAIEEIQDLRALLGLERGESLVGMVRFLRDRVDAELMPGAMEAAKRAFHAAPHHDRAACSECRSLPSGAEEQRDHRDGKVADMLLDFLADWVSGFGLKIEEIGDDEGPFPRTISERRGPDTLFVWPGENVRDALLDAALHDGRDDFVADLRRVRRVHCKLCATPVAVEPVEDEHPIVQAARLVVNNGAFNGRGQTTASLELLRERIGNAHLPPPELAVQPVEEGDEQVRVGHLPTVNQDEYPALPGWWMQLWRGEEVFARVYGDSAIDALDRARMVAAALTSPSRSVAVQTERHALLNELRLHHASRCPLPGETVERVIRHLAALRTPTVQPETVERAPGDCRHCATPLLAHHRVGLTEHLGCPTGGTEYAAWDADRELAEDRADFDAGPQV